MSLIGVRQRPALHLVAESDRLQKIRPKSQSAPRRDVVSVRKANLIALSGHHNLHRRFCSENSLYYQQPAVAFSNGIPLENDTLNPLPMSIGKSGIKKATQKLLDKLHTTMTQDQIVEMIATDVTT